MVEWLPPVWVGFGGLAVLLVLIFARFPIAVALALVSIVGLTLMVGWRSTQSLIASVPYDFVATWEMSAVPMFLLMGAISFHSGMTADLYAAARIWLGRLPGGLAVASNVACAGFAAASGSSVASTVAMGRIAVPEMLAAGYDRGLATSTVACAGTLGSLIPPSIIMIVYGIFAGASISQLFMAGVVPGIITALVYAVMIVIRVWLNPSLAPSTGQHVATLGEKLRVLAAVWPLPVLILGVIGSIYSGIATPTEAGALGVVFAALIAAVRAQFSLRMVWTSLREALEGTASILFISIGAALLTRFMVFSGLPDLFADYVGDAFSLTGLLLSTAALLVVLGCFLDPISLMLIALPMLLPAFQNFDVDLVWLGIIIIKFAEIGLMTPPVGLNIFAIKTVVGDAVPIETIFRGVFWFLVCEAIVILLLIAWPALVLWLPGLA